MLFKFACPNCGTRLEADSSYSGGMAECPHCETSVHVPDPRISPGTTVGGHRLESLLGRGGMGEVYLATQLAMDRQVAVKILSPGLTRDQMFVDRFLMEVRTAAKLEHPNIVTAFDAGEDDGVYYLAMGYVDGETLLDKLKRDGVFSESEVLHVARRLASALMYAWDNFGILHRDIKPANIMIDRFGEVKLMDLGVAKIVGEDTGLTMTGMALGTPNYMSPEQVRGADDIDCRADIYSFGCTMFHLLTARQPYSGKNMLDVMNQHVNAPIPSIRDSRPSVSPQCERFIHGLMAKDREKRPADWGGVLEQLSQVTPSAAGAAGRRSGSAKRTIPRWALTTAAGLAVLLLVGGLGALARREGGGAAVEPNSGKLSAGRAEDAAPAGDTAVRSSPLESTPPKVTLDETESTHAQRTGLTNELGVIADLLLARQTTAAVERWKHARVDAVSSFPASRVREIDKAMAIIDDLPGHVMASFERDVGKEIGVRLRDGGRTVMRLDRVEASTLHGTRRTASGAEDITVRFADLDPQEQLKRVGPERDRASELVRGLLFLGRDRRVLAMVSLKRSRNPLADAIIASASTRAERRVTRPERPKRNESRDTWSRQRQPTAPTD